MENTEETVEGLNISVLIEQVAIEKKIDHLQAAIEVARKLNWDPSWIAEYINDSVKEKIRLVGEEGGLLKREGNPAFLFE